MITGTKAETKAIARQPFDHDRAIEFCGSKKLAKRLLVNLGEALLEADKAIARGESEDTEFELMFWDGTLGLDEDDLYLYFSDRHYSEPVNEIEDYAEAVSYCDILDATIALCQDRRTGRKFIALRYEFKDRCYQHTGWWLQREVTHNHKKKGAT